MSSADTITHQGIETAADYIKHHMQHLQSGKMASIIDFSVINFDTIIFSIAMIGLVLFFLRSAAKRATPGVPGKFQCAVEMLVEMVNNNAKSIVHGDITYVAPLALTVFCWITLMNAIDLIPVDLLPAIASLFGVHYLRPLPTADLNGSLGMSLGVLLLLFYYSVKIKGMGGFIHELFTAPFGNHPALWVFNLALNIVEFAAKFVSLGMRLFGNMYAGELIFFLLALLAGFAADGLQMASLGALQVFASLIWWLFHILIVLLQAFIFMMLTLVYIGQAHSHH